MKTIKQLLTCSILVISFINCHASGEQSGGIKFSPSKIPVDRDYSIQAESGTLEVPENRMNPGSKTITLQVVRLKSTSPSPAPPVIYLAGGPGVSGISMLKTDRLIVFEALRAYGDVIVFDQRGTGQSKPVLTSAKSLNLPPGKPVDDPESLAAYYAAMNEMSDDARKKNIDLNAYNTLENAADVNDLRIALGAEKMVLWGYSYGSHLALAVIKQYGNFVEKGILSGVNGLDQRFRLPADINSVFMEMDRLIGLSPNLRKQIPSLPALIKQELEKLDKNPVRVNIIADNKPLQVTIGRTDVEILLALNTASIAFIREIPQLFYNMSQNNYSAIAAHVYKTIKDRPAGTPMSYSMHYASGVSEERMARIEKTQQEGIIRNAINFPFVTAELKNIWQVQDLGDSFRAAFHSDVPVLLLSGSLDGRTSITDAREVSKQFSNKTHIIFNNASHDLLAPQVIQVMENFMGNKKQTDTAYTVPGFEFYAPNSQQLIQKVTAMLVAGGMEGIVQFREYYTKLVNSPDSYVIQTQILPTVYQLFSMKKPELALEALKVNQELFKEENWQVLNAFGEACLETGNKEEALKYFSRSLDLNPLNFRAYKIVQMNKTAAGG